jgi:hypothetical protein
MDNTPPVLRVMSSDKIAPVRIENDTPAAPLLIQFTKFHFISSCLQITLVPVQLSHVV